MIWEKAELVDPEAPLWAVVRAVPDKWSGVYALRHLTTRCSYVGSTSNLRERIYGYLNDLRVSRHPNHALQDAWLSSGPRAFHLILLEPVESDHHLLERANYWIDVLGSLAPRGYNLRLQPAAIETPHRGAESAAKSALRWARAAPSLPSCTKTPRMRLV